MSGLGNFSAAADLDRLESTSAEKSETKIEAEEEERILLRNLAQGDVSTFWQLWERHQNYLYARCLRWMAGNHEDAEDALSNAMIKACKRLSDCAREITNLKGWLTRLTYNLCVDMQRERNRRSRAVESLEVIADTDEEAVAHAAHLMKSPEEDFVSREMYEHIYHLVNKLPPRLRKSSILRFFQGMRYRDIASQLNLSTESLRKCIQQARAILKDVLNKYLSDIDLDLDSTDSDPEEPSPDDHDGSETGRDNLKSDIKSNSNLGLEHALNRKLGEIGEIGEIEEMKSEIKATCLVQVILPSGVEKTFHLFLKHKPTRHHQKLETLSQYVQRHPRGWKKRLELADLLYAMGRWEEAIQQYQQVLERQPRLVQVWLQLGNILQLMEKAEEAISVYEYVLPVARKLATRRQVEGLIAIRRRQYAEATRVLKEAAALEPGDATHWQLLGSAYLQAESFSEALRAFDDALKINPNDIIALTQSYEALLELGQAEEAQRRVERVLNLIPYEVLALKRMADQRTLKGWVSGQAGTKTRQLLRRALRQAPGAADLHESLACYHIFRGEWDKGLAVLQRFTERHPSCPQGWYHYTQWLLHTGDSQAAAKAIMKAKALCPNDREIYRSSRQILTFAGRLGSPRGQVAQAQVSAVSANTAQVGLVAEVDKVKEKPVKWRYPLGNWKASDYRLVKAGRLTLWVDKEASYGWTNRSAQGMKGMKGAPQNYADAAIKCPLILAEVYHLRLRAAQELMKLIVTWLGVNLPVPDYTTLCRRRKRLKLQLPRQNKKKKNKNGAIHIVLETTGLSIYGKEEWKAWQESDNGKDPSRTWRKLLLTVDQANSELVATVTGN